MCEPRDRRFKTTLIPTSVTWRPEENGALVVIDPVDDKPLLCKKCADLRSDQTGGSRDDDCLHQVHLRNGRLSRGGLRHPRPWSEILSRRQPQEFSQPGEK